MSSKAISLFEKAVSVSESYQLDFAMQIDEIINSFSPEFIAQEFYPFLATWIPRNNQKIVSVIAGKVKLLGSVKGAFPAFATVVESLLASEKEENAKKVRKGILACGSAQGDDAFPFIKRLTASPLDFVRSFVPSIVSILSKEEDKKAIFSYLAYDNAFIARYNTCLSIPTLSAALGQQVALSLLKDGHSRIRALLAVVCVNQPYFFSAIAPSLSSDLDWLVRSTLAKEVVRSKSPVEALDVCSKLAHDGVWCVLLSALKSITTIIKRDAKAIKDSPAVEKIISTLPNIMSYPETSLKNAVIDTFVAIYQNLEIKNKGLESFVNDIISTTPPNTRLHFINELSKAQLKPIVLMIRDKLYKVVMDLLGSDQWRLRLGIINTISDITKLCEDKELEDRFRDICYNVLDDEAMQVRRAASVELAKFFIEEKSDKVYPNSVIELKNSNEFRKRQSAVILLSDIAKYSTKENKDKIIKEMKTFENDACVNVVNIAKDLITELQ